MPKTESDQAHCNACGGIRNHRVLKKVVKTWENALNERYTVWSEDEYVMLQCCGCDQVRLRQRSMFSEETDDDGRPLVTETYYPPALYRPHPKWFSLLDSKWHITSLLREVYAALQNSAPALASMGLRAVIEAIMIDKVGDNGSFATNLKKFRSDGFISDVQHSALSAALELGHASIHRGHTPNDFQLETAVDITENLIHGLYVIVNSAKASVQSLPPRKT